MSFQLCFNTSTIRPAPLMEKIRAASEAGYSAVELWCDDLLDYVEGGGSLAEVRRVLGDAGLSVPDLVHLPGWMDAEASAFEGPVLDRARKLMTLGAEVGAPRLIAGPAHGQADLDLAADRFARLMDLGREIGCEPTLEFLGFVEHVKTVDVLMEIVRRADVHGTTVVLDAFHIYRGGGRNEDILKVPGDQVSVFHIDDVPDDDRPREALADGDRVYPGDGRLDLPGMLRMLSEQGFDGPVSLELFRQDLWEADPIEVAKTGAEKVRRLLGQAA